MPEFMFRNLSVKLYPAGQACGPGTSQQVAFRSPIECCDCSTPAVLSYGPAFCDPTSQIQRCGSGSMFFCDYPSNSPTNRQPNCDLPSYYFACEAPTIPKSYVDPLTNVVIPAGADIRAELASLKADLQRKMAAVDARQQEVENAAKPTSVEQIDDLKSQLLAAMAELDEQRARMEGGGQAPASG